MSTQQKEQKLNHRRLFTAKFQQNQDDLLLSNAEAAEYLGVTTGTLSVWRSTKRYGIAFIKVGRLVSYRKSELDAFPFCAAKEVGAKNEKP